MRGKPGLSADEGSTSARARVRVRASGRRPPAAHTPTSPQSLTCTLLRHGRASTPAHTPQLPHAPAASAPPAAPSPPSPPHAP
eukprot:2881671-Rhodomonas_salina.1